MFVLYVYAKVAYNSQIIRKTLRITLYATFAYNNNYTQVLRIIIIIRKTLRRTLYATFAYNNNYTQILRIIFCSAQMCCVKRGGVEYKIIRSVLRIIIIIRKPQRFAYNYNYTQCLRIIIIIRKTLRITGYNSES